MREQAERAEKLQKFQADVQKRVSAIQKMKQQKEIERGMKDVSIEMKAIKKQFHLAVSLFFSSCKNHFLSKKLFYE